MRSFLNSISTILIELLSILVVICITSLIGIAQPITEIKDNGGIKESSNIFDLARPALRVFKDKDGLPQNSIMSMVCDRQGYLWVGTQDGLCRYNGRSWIVEKLPVGTVFIQNIMLASDDSIWLATDGKGIAQFKDGKWQIYTMQQGLPANQIHTLAETREGNEPVIWAGTVNGLARFHQGRWTVITDKLVANRYIYTIAALPAKSDGINSFDQQSTNEPVSDQLWVGTFKNGLIHYKNNRWTDITAQLPGRDIRKVLIINPNTDQQQLWVGTTTGLARFENNQWTFFNTKDGLPVNFIQTLTSTVNDDGTRTLWVGTNGGGLARFQNGQWYTIDTRAGLPSNQVMSLLETRSDLGSRTLWIGTNGGGLARLQNGQWYTIDTRAGLPNNIVLSMIERTAPDGVTEHWIGTYDGGLTRYRQGQWTTFNTSNVLPHNTIFGLLADSNGAIWAGTYAGGLMRYYQDKWTHFNTTNGLPNNSVISLLETLDQNGVSTIWIGTSGGGLATYTNGVWRYFNTNNGLPSDQILSLIETRDSSGSTIWVGTNGGGLASFHNNQWQIFSVKEGLPDNTVVSLLTNKTASGEQVLWAGTRGGLARISLDNPKAKWLTFTTTTNPALPNDIINKLCLDQRNRIYILTNRGIARLSQRNTNEQNASSVEAEYQIFNFNTEDGLASNECNQGAGLLDRFGRVWAGTVEGISIYDPANDIEGDQPKRLFIERAWLVGPNQPLKINQQLSYKENHIIFEYSLLSYFREGDTRYRTQLVGIDREPSEWSSDFKKEFHTLQDGNYIFKVWGRDYSGNISGPVEYAFHIRPAPWRTWWAYGFYVLSIAGIVTGVAYLRLRQLEYRNETLQQLVAERTAEVVKQRDEIKEKNTHILDSIRYAERIQKAMLPHQETIAEYFSDFFILFIPKDIVSGDFYWFHHIDGQIIIAVADCTGHGVPGAFMSMIGNALLSQIVAEKHITDPATILNELHNGIRYALKQNELDTETQDGMDIALCCIDRVERKITFAGARRPFYYLDSNGQLQVIKGDRRSIGGKQRENERLFTNNKIEYHDGIICYLTSDGYIDQNGNNQAKFGSMQFKRQLEQIAQLEMDRQQQSLLEKFNQFKGALPQRDDITIIGLRM